MRQDIFATADAGQWGFRLDSGRIAFDAMLSNGVVTVSAPFGRFREWTLSMTLRGAIGGKVFNSYRANYESLQQIGLRNILASPKRKEDGAI